MLRAPYVSKRMIQLSSISPIIIHILLARCSNSFRKIDKLSTRNNAFKVFIVPAGMLFSHRYIIANATFFSPSWNALSTTVNSKACQSCLLSVVSLSPTIHQRPSKRNTVNSYVNLRRKLRIGNVFISSNFVSEASTIFK